MTISAEFTVTVRLTRVGHFYVWVGLKAMKVSLWLLNRATSRCVKVER